MRCESIGVKKTHGCL